MKLTKFSLITLLAFLILPLQLSNAAETNLNRCIIVKGSGSLAVPADQATIAIGIETTNKDAQLAEQNNARIATAIHNQLLDFGISPAKITTTRYNFYPNYSNSNNKAATVIDYTVNNTVSVTITDLETVGKVIDSSIQLGANKINSINFSLQDPTAMEIKALQAAVNDAHAKAKAIAATLDKQVINVITVNESSTAFGNYRLANYAMKSASLDMAPTPIQSGTIEVQANVEITFEIN